MNRRLILLALFVSAVGMASAQTVDEAFKRGNELYRAGKFTEAAAVYEEIVGQGQVSAEVYYNLGSARYRSGNTARAILAYERALQLNPGDADISHNLKLANLRITDRIEAVPELFLIQWLHAIASVASLRTGAVLFAVAWLLLFGSLAVMFAVRSAEVVRMARWIAAAGAVLVLLTGMLLSIQVWHHTAGDGAIITGQVVTAKSSPDEQSVDAFVIHEGLKVRIGDRLTDWVKITLADGKVGWIKSSQCEQI